MQTTAKFKTNPNTATMATIEEAEVEEANLTTPILVILSKSGDYSEVEEADFLYIHMKQ